MSESGDLVDVVVVGTGAAGCAAALGALAAGASVAIVEKADVAGGTTAVSAGGFWIPNSSLMQSQGFSDPRPEALQFMARMGFPAVYDPGEATLGLRARDLALIEAFYDHAGPVVDELVAMDALHPTMWPTLGFSENSVTDPDYHAGVPENAAPYGHLLMPAVPPDFDYMVRLPGAVLAEELLGVALAMGATLHTGHRVVDVTSDGGAVTGVVCETGTGVRRIAARHGVVFASGGFSHDGDKARTFLRGPIFGTGATPANTGDFIDIAASLGAELGNMANSWWCQVVLDAVLASGGGTDLSGIVFVPYGDSMLIVNTRGVRVVDEKAMYHERTQSHFTTDGLGWPNLVEIMIWDQAVADDPTPWPWRGGVPLPGMVPPWVITADDLPSLSAAIDRRLGELRGRAGISGRVPPGAGLADGFTETLSATVQRFNRAATDGVDEEFGRGSTPISRAWAGPIRRGANPTMYPLSPSGPYHALLLCAGTLDTCGGPVIDASGAVQRVGGGSIPGLYGAGNCVAAPTGQGYLGGGGTIGPALTFGWLAGRSAAGRPTAQTAGASSADVARG